MSSKLQGYTSKQIMHLVIGFILMFGVGYVVPTFSTITRDGMTMFFAFAGWLWLVISGTSMLVASALGLFAITCTGYYTATEVMQSGMASYVGILLLFSFIIVDAFNKSRTGEVIIAWALSRKILNGKPWLFLTAYFVIIIVLGSFVEHMGVILLAIVVIMNLSKVTKLDISHDLFKVMLLFSVLGAGIAARYLYYKGMTYTYLMSFMVDYGEGIRMADVSGYLLSLTVSLVLMVPVWLLVSRYIIKIDMTKIKALNVQDLSTPELSKLSTEQILILIVTIVAFFFPAIQALFPAESFIYIKMAQMGQPMFMCFCCGLCSLIKVDGKRLVDMDNTIGSSVMWGVLAAIAVVTLCSGAFSAEDTGLSAFLLEILGPVFANLGFVGSLCLLALISCSLTQVFSNMATAMILVTITSAVAGQFAAQGINVAVMPLLIEAGTNTASLTFAASAQAAVILGNDVMGGTNKWMLKRGIVFIITTAICLIIGATVGGYMT